MNLRRIATLATALVSALPLVAQDETPTPTTAEGETGAPLPDGAPEAMKWIDRVDLRRHAEYLADDARAGRHTGSPGQQEAAEYIAAHFESLGLQPLGDGHGSRRSFFQSYPLERVLLDPKLSVLELDSTEFARGWALVPGDKAAKGTLSGDLLDCGHGDPADLPKGFGRKIPVVTLRSVGGGQRSTFVAGLSVNKIRSIQREMEGRGARGVVYLLDAEGGVADQLSLHALMPDRPLVSKPSSRDNAMRAFGDRPALFASGATGDAIRAAIEGEGKATLKLRYAVVEEPKFKAVNVVAMRPGKSKEAVVFSAHMDHVGIRIDGDVYNGADDNASGSSGLLDIAEAFSKLEDLDRTVIFLSVSGEELGLWGSEYFSDNPTWPLELIIADINIDMIGRLTATAGRDEIEVTPTFRHNEYSTLVQGAAGIAERMGMKLTDGDQYYQRSDHYNFARKGVPVVFFCNGEHPDYHKATDEVQKLDFAKMERVARLAFWTGFEVIGERARPRRLGSRDSW